MVYSDVGDKACWWQNFIINFNSRIWILVDCISNEILNFFVINFSIYRCNVCITTCCAKGNYSRKVPFSMNVALKRTTRITITRTLIRVHRVSFVASEAVRGSLPDEGSKFDEYQNIAYHQLYLSLHFDRDQSSRNQTYSSMQPDAVLGKH